MSGVKVYFLVGFRFCRCLAFSIIVFKRHDWCWMFLLADMYKAPDLREATKYFHFSAIAFHES